MKKFILISSILCIILTTSCNDKPNSIEGSYSCFFTENDLMNKMKLKIIKEESGKLKLIIYPFNIPVSTYLKSNGNKLVPLRSFKRTDLAYKSTFIVKGNKIIWKRPKTKDAICSKNK